MPESGQKNTRVGFVGLGTMGTPISRNMAQGMVANGAGLGTPLMVWNRSAAASATLAKAGADVAPTVDALFESCETIFLMLANAEAIDAVLGRGGPSFRHRIAGSRIVNLGTVAPAFSHALADDIAQAGGSYVEAPVSGSRAPAEEGTLVGMLAGAADDIEAVKPLLASVCREIFVCGPVPGALTMKLAVNLFLITMVTGLAEAAHFANAHALDPALFADILAAGPMANDVSKLKATKLATQNYERQASITDVLMNAQLVVEAARTMGLTTPLIEASAELYAQTERLGHGGEDMVAVIKALQKGAPRS